MFRTFIAGDEKKIIALWNQVLTLDPITPKRFRNQILLDVNFDPQGFYIYEENNEIKGVMLAITRRQPMEAAPIEKDTAWISFFFVHPEVEGRGIAEQLLQHVTEYVKAKGATKLYFSSYAPNYFLPGIDEENYNSGYQFLLRKGFRKLYSPVAMNRSLHDYTYPEAVRHLKRQREEEGYTFEEVQDGDFFELIHFATNHFNPDWGRAIREGVLNGMDSSQIMVAKNGKKIVGFALYGGYEGIRERFGPFGVDESEQGKGLGKILLHETLFAMRARTILGVWFLWTSDKSAAGHLYLKNGFNIYRKFHVMLKEL